MFFKQERAEMDDFVRAEKPWLQRKMFLFLKKKFKRIPLQKNGTTYLFIFFNFRAF